MWLSAGWITANLSEMQSMHSQKFSEGNGFSEKLQLCELFKNMSGISWHDG